MDERAEILSELSRLKEKLEKLEQLFDLTSDPDEIEALVHEEIAMELRRSRLLRRAKELGVTAGIF